VFAVYVLFLLTTVLILGSLSDHVGRRPVIITALAADTAACILFLLAHGVGALFAARALQGVAVGLAASALGAALLDLRPAGSLAPLVTSNAGTVGLALGARFRPASLVPILAAAATSEFCRRHKRMIARHPHPSGPGRDAPRPPRPLRHRPRRAPVPHRPRRPAERHRLRRSLAARPPHCTDPAQQASPLAHRPYDLWHAAVSLWLNAGVPATEVARRAGHGVAVLLKVYANCIDGQAATANQRINDALDGHDGQ